MRYKKLSDRVLKVDFSKISGVIPLNAHLKRWEKEMRENPPLFRPRPYLAYNNPVIGA